MFKAKDTVRIERRRFSDIGALVDKRAPIQPEQYAGLRGEVIESLPLLSMLVVQTAAFPSPIVVPESVCVRV